MAIKKTAPAAAHTVGFCGLAGAILSSDVRCIVCSPFYIRRGHASTHVMYGDYILMATPGATIEQAINLPDSAIDDGNSRTYLYAYILAP